MKRLILAVVLATAGLTVGFERLSAQVPNYCTLACQACWITWSAATGKFSWEADLLCSSGRTNECKYGIVVNLFDGDDPNHAWWSTGTTAWMNCYTAVVAYSQNLSAPPGMVRGHTYIANLRVNNAFLGTELCEDWITFTY